MILQLLEPEVAMASTHFISTLDSILHCACSAAPLFLQSLELVSHSQGASLLTALERKLHREQTNLLLLWPLHPALSVRAGQTAPLTHPLQQTVHIQMVPSKAGKKGKVLGEN